MKILTEEKYFDGEQELTLKIYSDGTKYYFNSKNQWHRADGPAIEYPDGYRSWWKNGKRHRLDGPAVEHSDGRRSWWIDEARVDCASQEDFERYLKAKILW